jgi:thymidylate synthase
MNTITPHFFGESADEVWLKAANTLVLNQDVGVQENRNGSTKEIIHATLQISDPRQRWVISRFPGISPAFAIAECIWIVMGKSDSAFLNYWNSQLPEYTGQATKYHGAYGNRLVHHFNFNQIICAYETLKNNPNSRQVVLQIWDPKVDFPYKNGKPRDPDIPCNVMCFLKIRDQKLEWTQIVRSNDLYLGVPYNLVQFTFLQEMIASWLTIDIGSYFQLSDSLHVYEKNFDHVSKSVKQPSAFVPNTDALALKKNETLKYFTVLLTKAEELTKRETNIARINEICKWPRAPLILKNYLLFLCAEASRKRKDGLMAKQIIEQCTNSMLRKLWDNWTKRWIK